MRRKLGNEAKGGSKYISLTFVDLYVSLKVLYVSFRISLSHWWTLSKLQSASCCSCSHSVRVTIAGNVFFLTHTSYKNITEL